MGVGLVVVSHSRVLADAAVALAAEMLHGQELRVAVAAGLDETAFGTDATAIEAAIRAIDDPAGVVVLMDLGSAVLSAELALELLEPEVAERVLLCPAPLVEGLVVAVVAAAGGATRAEVADEAMGALAAKAGQLGQPDPVATAPTADVPVADGAPDAVSGVFEVLNPHGLHARPAARLVQEVRGLDADVRLRNLTRGDETLVPAGSLSRVATLGALRGHRVEVVAGGPTAQAAVQAVLELAARAFDEVLAPAAPVTSPVTGRAARADGRALPASPGVAVGPARLLRAAALEVPDEPAGDPTDEQQRLAVALAAVRADVRVAREQVARDVSEAEASVFDAHLLLLDDPEVLGDAGARVAAGAAAPAAYAAAVRAAEQAFEALDDPYLRARGADVRAVGDQVLRHLLGAGEPVMPTDGVLVADDLTPAQVAAVDPATVAGIVLAGASPTSHSAILARARGIPMVVGAGPAARDLVDGTVVGLDGTTGELYVDPTPGVLADLDARREARQVAYDRALAAAGIDATTRDGVHVLVGVNGAAPAEVAAGVVNGADVVGLVRTEFLFLGRDDAPDVDEQVAAYRALAAAADGRRLTLRTLDVGGDKPLPYLPQPPEANPFLGVRGLRLALRNPALLAEQLRAIVTVAHETPVSVMFPMVSTVDELRAARAALDEAVAAVGPHQPAGLQVGVMVEVPALALKAAAVAPYVDFFSIGTNDLTQYTLAAERGNDAVADLGDPLDPAVLQLVGLVCRAAGPERLVAVCGELAAEVSAVPLLVGLGVRELSVSPAAVALVKEAVRATHTEETQRLVASCLAAGSAADVRALLATG